MSPRFRQKGKSGVGANKRTAEYAGGGAVLGGIIGAGAGALTQVLTKGRVIKAPAESMLTFQPRQAVACDGGAVDAEGAVDAGLAFRSLTR
jgi:hypothetical protein